MRIFHGCDRCGRETGLTIMSRFNTETICMECEGEEKHHPDYPYARARELEAVKKRNYNFPGIGWPGTTGRVSGYLVRDLEDREASENLKLWTAQAAVKTGREEV